MKPSPQLTTVNFNSPCLLSACLDSSHLSLVPLTLQRQKTRTNNVAIHWGNKQRADNSFSSPAVLVVLSLPLGCCYFVFRIFLIGFEMEVKVFTYKSDSPLNVGVLEVAAADGLVRLVQLPGDAKVSEEDEQTGQEGAEHGQSQDESGVVQRVPVARPVH